MSEKTVSPIPVHQGEIPKNIKGPCNHIIGYFSKLANIPFTVTKKLIQARIKNEGIKTKDKTKIKILYETSFSDNEFSIVFSNPKDGYAEIIEINNDKRYVIAPGGADAFWYYDPQKLLLKTKEEVIKEIGTSYYYKGINKERNNAYICDSALEAISLCALLPEELQNKSVFIGCGRDIKRAASAAYYAEKSGLQPVIAAPENSFRDNLMKILPESPIIAPEIHSWNMDLDGDACSWYGPHVNYPEHSEWKTFNGETFKKPYYMSSEIIDGEWYVRESNSYGYVRVTNPNLFYESWRCTKDIYGERFFISNLTPEEHDTNILKLSDWIKQISS